MGLFDSYKALQEQQKKNNPDRKPTQAQLSIRILVGGYLYYLIYQLLKGGVLDYTGWQLAIMIAGMILFAGFGGYFIVKSLMDIIRHNYYDPNA